MKNEFANMFKQMNIDVSEVDNRHMFSSIDIDNSGSISWTEFKHDFDRCVQKTVKEMEQEDEEEENKRILHEDFSNDTAMM